MTDRITLHLGVDALHLGVGAPHLALDAPHLALDGLDLAFVFHRVVSLALLQEVDYFGLAIRLRMTRS